VIALLLLWEHVRANLGPRGVGEPLPQYACALAPAQRWTRDCRLAASSTSVSGQKLLYIFSKTLKHIACLMFLHRGTTLQGAVRCRGPQHIAEHPWPVPSEGEAGQREGATLHTQGFQVCLLLGRGRQLHRSLLQDRS